MNELPLTAFVASALGVLTTVIFFAFDTRNLHLIRRSIGTLEFLEVRTIYPDDMTGEDEPHLGLLRRNTQEREKDRRQTFGGEGEIWKIKYWLRTLYLFVGVGFVFSLSGHSGIASRLECAHVFLRY